MTYVYVYEDEHVCDGVCGDGSGDGELGISGISEVVDSSEVFVA